MEGRLLGNRYELIERIGGGGMAIVYKAKCRLLNRYVAIKVLRSEFIDDEEFVRRFRIEAQAAASLSHPNIVSIFDVGQDQDTHYIVMEYIDGITLKEYICNKGALNWKEAVGIAIQICSATEHAHKNHIVHRDIKPHNIMITSQGIAKVTDFGIARAASSATITMAGNTIGSVHYFSPEQARGGFVDEKSDLYSLGITIYEMATGRVPFDGETHIVVAMKQIQQAAEKPTDINPAVPKGLNDLIVKSIKKDQNLRYQSASMMLADLQRLLGEPNATISGSNLPDLLSTRKMPAVVPDMTGSVSAPDIEGAEAGEDEYGEGSGGMRKRKKDRLSVWLGVTAGLIIAAIIVYIGLAVIMPVLMPDNSEAYIVVDYASRNFSEVRDELAKVDITAMDSDREYSDTIAENIIISQDVAVGNKLKPGSTIHFTVSSGPELVTIADVKGKETRIAEPILQDQDLQTNVVTEYSDSVGTGLVIRTIPTASEKVRPGELVTIVESLGPELVKTLVPNLVGMNRADAQKLLEQSKLTMGKMLPEGIVDEIALIIRQYPAAGTEVDEGTPVEMTFDTTGTAAGTLGQSGQPSSGTSSEPAAENNAEALKSISVKIALDANRSYGEEIMVYVEATPSDTNQLQIVYNKSVAKTSFPLSVPVTLAKNGSTHIIVKLDGVTMQEGDY